MARLLSDSILNYLTKFNNSINGSCTAGLAGQSDAGLRESEKLPLAPPAAIDYTASQDASITLWSHGRNPEAVWSQRHCVGDKQGELHRDDEGIQGWPIGGKTKVQLGG